MNGCGAERIPWNNWEWCVQELYITHSMKIPSNVTTICHDAFSGCESLIEVRLNNVLNTLGPDAFNSCTSLVFIEIPASITIVRSGTFYNCTSLKMAVLNDDTTLIDEEAFRECNTLISIIIPNVSISPTSNLTQEIFEQSFPTLSNMDITLDWYDYASIW